MSAFEQLREAMASALNVDANMIKHNAAYGYLAAWDSMGHIHLMVALEDTFDIHLEVEDFSKLTSVTAMLDYLKSHGIE